MEDVIAQILAAAPVIVIATIVVLMFMNSSVMFPPSELICATAGYWAASAGFNWGIVAFFATVANVAGTAIWFHLGNSTRNAAANKYAGAHNQRIERTFTFLTRRELDYFLTIFQREGWFPVFVLRLIPLVRSVVSYAAGYAKMNPLKFYVWTFLGMGVWCCAWTWAGYFYGQNADNEAVIKILAAIALCGGLIWVLRKRIGSDTDNSGISNVQ